MEEQKAPGKSNRFWLILIGLLLAAGIGGLLLVQSSRTAGTQVVITWQGEENKVLSLGEDQTLIYEGDEGQRNVVAIRDGVVFMEEANCPDQICVRHGPTDQTADPIVCLPNSLVVNVITNETENQLDGVS